jgi:hypothetical protein
MLKLKGKERVNINKDLSTRIRQLACCLYYYVFHQTRTLFANSREILLFAVKFCYSQRNFAIRSVRLACMFTPSSLLVFGQLSANSKMRNAYFDSQKFCYSQNVFLLFAEFCYSQKFCYSQNVKYCPLLHKPGRR